MKTKIITMILMIGLFYSCKKDNSTNSLNVGLVAYYPFNGNANDESGNGNNGTVFGATLTKDRFGNPNSAYSFNGINNYIRVLSPKGLNNANYTYSFWLMILQLPATYNCNFLMELGYPSMQGHAIAINNAYPSINQTTGWSINSANSATSSINFQTGTLPNANVWYNVLVIRNDTSVCVYENGKKIKNVSTNGNISYYTNPSDLYFGTRASKLSNFYLNGIIDDIRIYNRALTVNEIIEIQNINK
jgi:hypothetical protein